MRRLAVVALLGVACTSVEPPPADPGPGPAEVEGDDVEVAQAEQGWLDPSFSAPDDDDDTAVDGDDDDATLPPIEQFPCPDPGLPAPETPFTDVTTCAGVVAYSGAEPPLEINGQAWADVDADGDLDLYVTDALGPNTLFLSDGAGRFEASSDPSVALPDQHSSGATFVDYDNDGDPDLYVLAKGPNALLRNDGLAGWVDVAADAGLDDPGHGMTSAFADVNADGWLDVYVANYECTDCAWLDDDVVYDDGFYLAAGDGTFTDAAALLDLDLMMTDAYGAAWFDFDNDGDLDLYLANDRGHSEPWAPGERVNRNLLWRNEGDGCGGWCFSEVGVEVGADLRITGMGVAVGDYDGDGWLDVAVTDGGPVRLLRNLEGMFVDVTVAAGLGDADVKDGWGVAFLDHDLDGDLDLYFVDGRQLSNPNWLFENQGDGMFADVSEGSGASESGHSTGLAVAAYDADGWPDLVVGNREGDYQVFRNLPVGDPHWLRIRLSGAGSGGADAVGARVVVTDSGGTMHLREVARGAGLGASDDPALHFGMGDNEPVEVIVSWPDGAITTLGAPPTRVLLDLAHPNP